MANFDREYIDKQINRFKRLRFVRPAPVKFLDDADPLQPSHRHNYYELRFPARDSSSAFSSLEIAPPGNYHHAARLGVYRDCRIVTVYTQGQLKFCFPAEDGSARCFVNDSPTAGLLVRQIDLLRSAIESRLPEDLIQEMFGALMSLLILLFRNLRRLEELPRADSRAAITAYDYIFANYSHPELSVREVAAAAGVNATYLPQLFRRHFARTVRQVIIEVRLRRACELLAEGEHSIREISRMCGWSDHSYFSNSFRRRFQMTPAQFAKLGHAGHIMDSGSLSKRLDEEISPDSLMRREPR